MKLTLALMASQGSLMFPGFVWHPVQDSDALGCSETPYSNMTVYLI
jgi:hypothetical protein